MIFHFYYRSQDLEQKNYFLIFPMKGGRQRRPPPAANHLWSVVAPRVVPISHTRNATIDYKYNNS